MSGFVLTTQLSIAQSEISKIKQQLNAGGGKGISPFTINLKLNLDTKEVDKIDKKLQASFGVRPIEVHLIASKASYKNVKSDLFSFTNTRPVPIVLTASPYSYKLIRDKVNAAFKSGKLAIFRVPFLPKNGSIKAIRKHFQDAFDRKPLKTSLIVSRSSLSAMRTQIQSYFAKTPVVINAKLGNATQNASQKTKNPNASFGSNFQPQNKSQASGVKIAKSVEHYGTFTAAVGTFVSLFRAMDDAVKEAIKFDREMVRISQVTGVSVNGLKDLQNEVSKVSKEFGVSSSDILKSAVTLSQAGLSANDTRLALEAVAKTGVSATFGDIHDTTEASIAIFQQFGKQASDLESILSSVNKVSGAFAVESEDITVAVRRAGGAFKAAGGDFNEFMALFTSVRQTTRESAESIATGFRTIFARLQRSSTQNFLKQLDIDLLDEGQFVGPYEAIKRISTALKDVQSTDPKFAQIVEELGGFRQVSKVIPLLQQFTISERALQIALRGGNSLTEDAVLSQQSLEVQLNKLKQEFLDTVRAFSNNTAIKNFISQMIQLSSVILEVVKSLSSVAPLIGTVALLGAVPKGKQVVSGIRGYYGFASGGQVPGSGNSDTVPAMLTPGEYVLRKSVVNKIGKDRLDKLNSSNIKGYNKGGVVQHFAGGGIVNGLSSPSGIFTMFALISSFSNLNDESKNTTNSVKDLGNVIASSAIQFMLFKSVMMAFKDSFKDNKLLNFITPKFKGTSGSQKIDNSILANSKLAKTDLYNRLMTKYGPAGSSPNPTKLATKLSRGDALINSYRGASIRTAFDKRQERLSNYALIGGSVVSAAGGYLLDKENEKISRGEGSAYNAAGASFMQGAGNGAVIGSIAGPWGAAIGATIGGLTSFYNTLTDASEEIKKVGIDKSFNELESRLKKVFSNKLSVSDQSSFVSNSILEQSKNIGQLSGQRRSDALARFKNDQVGIEKFFEEVAKGSSDIKDFNDKTKSTLSTFSFLSGIPFNELNDNIVKIIESTKKANERIKENNSVIKTELDSRIRLIELEGAINSAFANVSNLDRATNNAGRLFGKDSSESIDIDDILKNASVGRFSNTSLVKKLVENVGTNLGGFGEEDTSSLKSIIDIPAKLPRVLNKIYSQDKLGSTGSFIDRFSKELDSEFAGLAPDVKRSILAALNEIIGEEGQESNLFEKIIEDMENVVDKLSKSTKPLFDSFGVFAKKIQEEEKKLVNSLSVYNDVLDKVVEIGQKSRDAERDRVDFNNSLYGKSPDLSTIKSRRFEDISSKFKATNVGDIFSNYLNSRNRLSNAIETREGSVGNIVKFNELTIQISELENAAKTASAGLEDIAYDSSGYVQSLKQLVEKTRQETQIRSDFAKTLASGSKEDRFSLAKDIYNAARVASSNNLNAVPINEQDSVIQFLRKQGNLQVFGKRGEELANELQIKAIVQNSMGLIGEDLAKQLIENKPKELQEILAELNVAYNQQQLALDAISSNLISERDKLKNAIDKSAADIIKTLTDIQKQNETSRVQNKRNELEIKKTGLEARLDAINKVNDITGFGTDLNAVNKARSLLTLSKDIKERETNRKVLLDLDPVKNVKFGPQETTEGALSRIESEISKSIPGFSFSNNLRSMSQSEKYNRNNLGEKESRFSDKSRSEYLFQLINEEFRNAKEKAIKNNNEAIINSKTELRSSGFTGVVDVEALHKLFKIIGDDNKSSADSLGESIDKLSLEIRNLRLPGMASGGFVSGIGNKDSVASMLMPGEFVLNKLAVKKIGLNNLHRMNNGNVDHYATGGFISTLVEAKRNKDNYRKIKRTRDQRAYENYNTQSERREKNRLRAERLNNQRVSEQKRQAKANANVYSSMGEGQSLRDYKSSLYFNSLPKKHGPRLKVYNLTPEQEEEKAREFHERALFLQKKYNTVRLASGGFIPGSGNKDSVPSMLMPGEFVLKKEAVKKIGVNNLHNMNNGNINHFSGGGVVGTLLSAKQRLLKIKQDKDKFNRIEKVLSEGGILGAALEAKFAKSTRKEEKTAREQKSYDIYNAQSEIMERNRLGIEKLNAQKVTEQKRQAAANAKVQQSRGEHNALREYKSSIYFNSLPKKNGPRLRTYNLTPEQEEEKAREFRERAIFLQRKYQEQAKQKFISGSSGLSDSQIKADALRSARNNGVYSAATAGYNPLQSDFKPISNTVSQPKPVSQFKAVSQTKPATVSQPQQIVQQAQPSDNFKEFNQNSAQLATALNNFSSNITITANHKVEVIFNGAEVLSKINESVAGIAVNEVAKQLDAYAVKNGLPRPNNVVLKGGK